MSGLVNKKYYISIDAVVAIYILFIPVVSWMVSHRNLTCPLVLFKSKKYIFFPHWKTKQNKTHNQHGLLETAMMSLALASPGELKARCC